MPASTSVKTDGRAKTFNLGFWWSRTGSNRRPPECHFRVCLGTYANTSCPEHLTSVWTCPHMCENARVRRALDLISGPRFAFADSTNFPFDGASRRTHRGLLVLAQDANLAKRRVGNCPVASLPSP